MKVILTREVKSVGKPDDVVNVAEGYARNFLFPRNLAVPANDVNMAALQKRKKTEAAKGEKLAEEAKDLSERIAEVKVTVKGKTGTGTKLYGSITPADIAEALAKQTGIKIDKRKIHLDEPIKTLGEFDVPIHLHHETRAHLKVEVVGE